MTTASSTTIANAPVVNRVGEVDNRATYVSFGLAYIVGHGAAAISQGDNPLVTLPAWLPLTLLGIGLGIGTVCATVAALRAQRGASEPDVLSGKLLGASWAVAFIALFLAITGLSSSLAMPELQSVLWPAGSGLIVGLMYLSEGRCRAYSGSPPIATGMMSGPSNDGPSARSGSSGGGGRYVCGDCAGSLCRWG